MTVRTVNATIRAAVTTTRIIMFPACMKLALRSIANCEKVALMTTLSAHRLATLLDGVATSGDGPLYQRIAGRIRLLALDGRVMDATRLPSERQLADALGVSRTTTTQAYAQLRDLGLVTSRRGSGTVIALPVSSTAASPLVADPHDSDAIALTFAAPAGTPGLASAFETAAARLPELLATSGYLPDGLPELRAALADRYTRHGLPTDPEQIIITNGAMGAISLVSRTFLTRGRQVAVEPLSYPFAHDALAEAGGRLSALPIADSIWDSEALAALAKRARPQLAYIIPDFHNPTGTIMTHDERESWARLLRRHDIVPLVDETLREVNVDDVDLPAHFACYDDRTLTVGSASKEFWAGLRLGWIRAPHSAVSALIQHRMAHDLGSAAFDQLVLTALLSEGSDAADVGRQRSREARDHLIGELSARLREFATDAPAGGLSLWLRLPKPVSTRLVAAASARGLILTPGPRFVTASPTVGENHLRMPFAAGLHTLSDAVERLAAAWRDVQSGPDHRVGPERRTLDFIA